MATIHTKLKRIKTLSESVIVLLLTSLLAFKVKGFHPQRVISEQQAFVDITDLGL